MKLAPSALAGFCGMLFVALGPALAHAQTVGVGPRFSFVRGDIATETPSSRLLGGSVRVRTSERTSLELSMDYRTIRSADQTTRTRQTPMQATLVVMPLQAMLTPYALAGLGIYSQKMDTLDATGALTDSALTRQVGWHAGFGGQLRLGRRAAVYADYRYQFVAIDRNAVSRIPFTHKGSMWTSGVAFLF
jgi:opacity protein-like surface antigen